MCHRVSIELDIFLDFLCSASLPLSACERTDLLEQLWPLLDGSLTPSPTPAVVVAPRAPTPAPAIQPLTVWQLPTYSENGSPSASPTPRAIPVKETAHFKFAAHGGILATVPRSLIWSLSPRPFQESSVTRLRPLVSCVSVLRVPIYHEHYPPPPLSLAFLAQGQPHRRFADDHRRPRYLRSHFAASLGLRSVRFHRHRQTAFVVSVAAHPTQLRALLVTEPDHHTTSPYSSLRQ